MGHKLSVLIQIDLAETLHGASPVQVVPHDLPAHRPAPARAARSVQELGWAA
ncbi:hypothetical protein [Kocuria sp. U4B]